MRKLFLHDRTAVMRNTLGASATADMKKDTNTFILLTFILTALPTMAFANAGSPMMWFGIFHSLALNAIIGVTESAIVTKFGLANSTGKIILGNYVSMFIGLYFIAPNFSATFGNSDFWGGQTYYGHYQLTGFFAGMFFSYLATLIIEYPFFLWALRDKNKKNELLKPFFIANTVTNIAMTLVYFLINVGG